MICANQKLEAKLVDRVFNDTIALFTDDVMQFYAHIERHEINQYLCNLNYHTSDPVIIILRRQIFMFINVDIYLIWYEG